jgi:hypothetical protein
MPLENFNLPVGRIVSGNPASMQPKTNFKTKQPEIGKDGKQITQSRCEIAIPKAAFGAEVWPKLVQVASEVYGPINPQTGQPNVPRDFSWKVIDGDSPACPKGSNVPYNTREGYPGHYVLKLSTEAFCPKIFKYVNGAFFPVEANEIKTGDYVVANLNVKCHSENDGGLYLNPNLFQLVGVGTAIVSAAAANPEQAFGNGANYQLPAGAQPIGSMPAAPTNLPPAPMAAPQNMGAGAPLPPPAHDFVQNMGMPPAPQPVAALSYAPSAVPAPQPVGLPVATPTATYAPASPINWMPMPPQR